jgi:hypothetical protein
MTIKRKPFDGLKFHRVTKDFMIQEDRPSVVVVHGFLKMKLLTLSLTKWYFGYGQLWSS